eukprot:s3041_g16.t1
MLAVGCGGSLRIVPSGSQELGARCEDSKGDQFFSSPFREGLRLAWAPGGCVAGVASVFGKGSTRSTAPTAWRPAPPRSGGPASTMAPWHLGHGPGSVQRRLAAKHNAQKQKEAMWPWTGQWMA